MVFAGCGTCCCNEDARSQVEVTNPNPQVGFPLKAFEDEEDPTEPVQEVRFKITITKTPALGKLGLDTCASRSDSVLRIQRVKSEGLIAAWNAENPFQAVGENDQITEVNGVVGSKDDLYDAIAKDNVLTLTILRKSPPDAMPTGHAAP